MRMSTVSERFSESNEKEDGGSHSNKGCKHYVNLRKQCPTQERILGD